MAAWKIVHVECESNVGSLCPARRLAILLPFSSVRRRGKKTSTRTRRRSRIPCVVVEKITTRRLEGVYRHRRRKKVDELSTKIRVIYLQQ